MRRASAGASPIAQLGVSEFFLGVTSIPIIDNAAEHGADLMMAAKNTMDLAFNAFEEAAVALGVGVVTVVSLYGEPNWLEGAQLLAV